MQFELPIFGQIRRDGSLPPRAIQVWCAAIAFLDVVDYRRLKLAHIETVLEEVDKSTVSRMLALLVERGWLRKCNGRYRVPLSRVIEVDDGPDDEAGLRGETLLETAAPSTPNRPSARRLRARVHSSGVL
jgi:hypothetical protein